MNMRFDVVITTISGDQVHVHLREKGLRVNKAAQAFEDTVTDETKRMSRGGGLVTGFDMSNQGSTLERTNGAIIVRSENGVPEQVSLIELRVREI